MVKLFKKVNSKKFARFFALIVLFAVAFSGAALVNAFDARRASASIPGGECDDNAIIRCGVSQNGIASAVAGLDAKGKGAYAHAGFNGVCSTGPTVIGVTTSDNRVVVGGRTVATGVHTYGRQFIPGSTQIPGGAWMRPPSVSFNGSAITSYVCMDGQEFKWAVISTCGNPVTGTPSFRNNPRISIHKTVSKQVVQPGETFNYSVTVRNTGNVPLTNVKVVDILPRHLEPVGLNDGVTYNPANRKITWPVVPRMAVNQQFTKTFKVRVADNAPAGTLVNKACVDTDQSPQIPLCDDVPVIVKKPSVKIEKNVSATSPVDVNQEFDYVIKATNTGQVRLTNVHITDTLPDGVVAVANPNSRTVEFTIDSLAPGASKNFTFKAKVVVFSSRN